jgi:hypothetical protein
MSTKELEEVIYTRLTDDTTLMAFVGQGVHNTSYDGDDFDTSELLTWVTFRVAFGGDTNDCPSDRFKDVSVLIEAHAQAKEGPEIILQMDERIGELFHEWIPVLASWPQVWETLRTGNFQIIERIRDNITSRTFGSYYRFRFGQPV